MRYVRNIPFMAQLFTCWALTIIVLTVAHTHPRDVTWGRHAPCATCGHAQPVTLHCENADWYLTEPGSIGQLWAKYCPDQTYTWENTP